MGLFSRSGAETGPREAPEGFLDVLIRIANALERLAGGKGTGYRALGVAKGPRKGKEEAISYVDDAQLALLEARREYYELSTGKQLLDDEEPPALPGEEELQERFVGPSAGA